MSGYGYAAVAASMAHGILSRDRPVELPLSETFGPTFQGEGPHVGRRCWFVRLGLCNLSCEWCDTPFTWDRDRFDVKAENPDTPVEHIADQLTRLGVTDDSIVVLSGGEPLIHHASLPALFAARPARWHAETNGTIRPPAWWAEHVEHTSVSPKIATRDPRRKRIKPSVLAAWNEVPSAVFKFVVQTIGQLDEVTRVVTDVGIPRDRVWIMPEGTTPTSVNAGHTLLADAALDHGYNMTTRLHVLTWGEKRGR